MDLFAELTSVARAFDAASIEYALCGAVALAIHGAPRATQDLDLLVLASDLARIREVVRDLGFAVEALPMRFEQSGIAMHRFTKLSERPLMLDLLLAEGPAASAWETRMRVPYSEGELSVVSREGLITLKLVAARPQDLVDIRRLQEIEA